MLSGPETCPRFWPNDTIGQQVLFSLESNNRLMCAGPENTIGCSSMPKVPESLLYGPYMGTLASLTQGRARIRRDLSTYDALDRRRRQVGRTRRPRPRGKVVARSGPDRDMHMVVVRIYASIGAPSLSGAGAIV